MSVTVRLATPEDDASLRRLTRETSMPGRVRLAIVHGYDPDAQTVVAERNGRLIGCGKREVRERFINGGLAAVAYLSAMRLTERMTRAIVHGYGLLRELHEQDGSPVTYTSIMRENQEADSLLNANRKGLPDYTFIGNYFTSIFPIRRLRRRSFRVTCVREPVVSRRTYSNPRGVSDWHFAERPRDLVRQAKTMIVHDYAGALRLLRPFLPPINEPLRIGCLTRRGSRRPLDAYADAVDRGWTHIMFGGPQPMVRGRRLLSRLYTVRWPGDSWELDDRPVWPEVADL